MKTILSTHDIAHALSSNRDSGFSYTGAYALAEYLEALEEDTGEETELDTVAIRCEFSEYESALEAASQYNTFLEVLEGEDYTDDEKLEKALEYLEDNTTVITFDGGVIIQDF